MFGGVKARYAEGRPGKVSVHDFKTVVDMAEEKGVSPHQLVMAYVRQKWNCVCLIVGCRKKERIDELVKIRDGLVLFTEGEMEVLDAI